MTRQTAMQSLWDYIDANCHEDSFNIQDLKEVSIQKEKEQIINAIMYTLDEDGHTGDWKIKFANDYYNKLNKGYDIRNTTGERFFGDSTFQTP